MIKERVILTKLPPDSWTDVHNAVIAGFISNGHRLLVAYNDPVNGLTVDSSIPFVPVSSVLLEVALKIILPSISMLFIFFRPLTWYKKFTIFKFTILVYMKRQENLKN